MTYHMKPRHYFATLLFAFLGTGAVAAEREYQSVDEFARSLPASPKRLIDIAEGDLNGDGLSDRAILTSEGDGLTHQLYILLQTRDGGFLVAQKSKQNIGLWESVSLSIEKGSLFVNIEGVRPPSGAKHQFKFYRGIWRLIGLRYSGVIGNTADGGVATRGFDWNVLTGDVMFENEDGSKSGKRGKWATPICRLDDYAFEPEFCTADVRALETANQQTQRTPSTTRSGWRQLAKGMSEEEVRALLGEPDRVDASAFVMWRWKSGGSVKFYEGAVDGWSEPR